MNTSAETQLSHVWPVVVHSCLMDPLLAQGWDDRTRFRQYRFGYYPMPAGEGGAKVRKSQRGGDDIPSGMGPPSLIRSGEEAELNVHQFMRKRSVDGRVVIVPVSQVGPFCDTVCNGCATCTQGRLLADADEKRKREEGKAMLAAAERRKRMMEQMSGDIGNVMRGLG